MKESQSLRRWAEKEGYLTEAVGNHGGGCGGQLRKLEGGFTFCVKCNASGTGGVRAARKSGVDRLKSQAERRAS